MLQTVGLGAVLDTEETAVHPDQDGLDDATIFEILGNERRRACLHCLAEHETGMSVSSLGRQVARAVADAGTDSDELYDSVYISLCQTHLPKLDAVGLIEYDHDRKQVARGPGFDAIKQQFEAAHTLEEESKDTAQTTITVSMLTVAAGAVALVSPPTARTILLFGLIAVHLLILAVTSTSISSVSY
jgi:DNA-binding transcriptional ArsR family regulator